MKLAKTLLRIGGNLDDLRRAARDLGHEFPRHRFDVLARFRASATEAIMGNEFEMGYKEALLDLTAAFMTASGYEEPLPTVIVEEQLEEPDEI